MHARTHMVALTLVLGVLSLARPAAATAATVTVTDCGDTGGPGQLRTLINDNNAGAGGDVISVPACTITLTTAASPLTVSKDVTVTGAGAQKTIVDGAGITTVWHVTAGTATLSRMTIRNGSSATAGGGILIDGGSLTLRQAIVRDNHAVAAVGIFDDGGTLKVFDSLVVANTAVPGFGDAGGIGITGTNASATITNTTVSGNSATANGGGIAIAFSASATLTLINSTVANNSADNSGGGIGRDGVTGPITLLNTIVADNVSPSGANCNGSFTSQGHNLESANTCGLDPVADLIAMDPMLGPLQLNGGPTPTHALLPGSPAIDAGDNFGCPSTDQRGVPRRLDATSPGFTVCDIGAFEVETLGFIQASLALDTASVHPGTQLQGTVSLTNVGGARPVDAYLVFVPPAAVGPGVGCPGNDALVFVTGGGARFTCLSSGVQTFVPLMANVSIPADRFSPVSGSLFSFTWPAGAPVGPWTVALVLTPGGAFADGRVNPVAGLVIAPAAFTVSP